MFECNWNVKSGWNTPRIIPFEDIEIDPRCEGLQYSVGSFEGMKAFKSEKDEVVLFRPLENFKRFQKSS